MKKFTKAVVIGRFNPVMHKGHVSMVRKGLEVAEVVYIVIGSANKFPDVKNPVPVRNRHFMVQAVLMECFDRQERSRIRVVEVNDYKYNDEKWKTEVRFAVREQRRETITMVGYEKDEDSYWLKSFGWEHTPVEPHMVDFLGKHVPMSSTFIRDAWLRNEKWPLTSEFPAASIEFLKKYTWHDDHHARSEFVRLHEERLMWDKEIKKFEAYPYPEALNCCTADAVVVCNNHVLLIERKFHPGKGAWALPGGHKEANETFRYCALRELEEEVKLKVPAKALRGSIHGEKLFDDPNRSPVFSKPTVAYYIVLDPNNDGSLPKVKASSDAKKAKWVPLHELKRNPILFDDHIDIVQYFVAAL